MRMDSFELKVQEMDVKIDNIGNNLNTQFDELKEMMRTQLAISPRASNGAVDDMETSDSPHHYENKRSLTSPSHPNDSSKLRK